MTPLATAKGRDGSTGALGTLAAAKEYAAAGLDVYPVWQTEEDGRKPKAPACGHGYKDSTRDEAQIARWWGGGSELGVSLRTGEVVGGIHRGKYLLVIDVDRANGRTDVDGEDMLRRWLDGELDGIGHSLPQTLEASTPSGGRHLYYLSESPLKSAANGHLRIGAAGRADRGRRGPGGAVGQPLADRGRRSENHWQFPSAILESCWKPPGLMLESCCQIPIAQL